jgi:alcohol dehydrogenase (cytochrome c)
VHQAAPLVNGGVMFVTSPNNQVIAIDVKSGNLLWRYRRPLETGMNVPHQTNRGVALYGDKVFFAAGEAVLVALDARTGREVWTTVVADNTSGYYTTLAPLVAGGVVMVGASGGEFGIRGFVAGFDVDTGKERWRTYTVPAPGEPGSETWPKGDHWKTGGAPVWVTGNYDPETNLAYWGTGNGGPTIGDQRPGDNLYVTSTVALDVATGAIKGHHQYHPNDSWTGTRCRRRSSSTTSATAAPSRASSTSRGTGTSGSLNAVPARSDSSRASRSCITTSSGVSIP